MTDTTTRPLPTDHGTLKAYLPPEPADTTAARPRDAIGRLDTQVAAARAELDRIDSVDRGIVNALIDSALDDDGDLEVLAARLDPGNRHVVEHRLAQLGRARNSAAHRHTHATLTDPAQLAWKQRCADITREWQVVMGAETSEDRFAGLVAFAERH